MEYIIGSIVAFGFYGLSDELKENWIPCDGNLISTDTYNDLYNVLGTTYGGDDRMFQLPDLRARIPVTQGQQPGGTNYKVAATGGADSVTLTEANLPAHTHAVLTARAAVGGDATSSDPKARLMATAKEVGYAYGTSQSPPGSTMSVMTPKSESAGSSQPVNIINPFVGVMYCICHKGVFPSRVDHE